MPKTECHYCETPAHCQMDHYPVPVRAGGVAVVPACTTCHNLKDRVPLTNWPADIMVAAITALLPWVKANAQPGTFDLREVRSWPVPSWGEIPPMGRVLYGKMRAVSEDMP